MAAPLLDFVETNGLSPGTTADIGGNTSPCNFASIDAPSNTPNILTNPIQQGGFSFEKYTSLIVMQAAPNLLEDFSVYYSPNQPTDAAGAQTVVVLYGTASTYAKPVETQSQIATLYAALNIAPPGAAIAAPSNIVGSSSTYFVEQLQIQPNATKGLVEFPNPFKFWQFSWA